MPLEIKIEENKVSDLSNDAQKQLLAQGSIYIDELLDEARLVEADLREKDAGKENTSSHIVQAARKGKSRFTKQKPWYVKVSKWLSPISCIFVGIMFTPGSWSSEQWKPYAFAAVVQAVSKIHNRILVNVKYTIRPGKRDKFLEKVIENGIITASKAELGNYKYEYYKPVDSEDVLFLIEMRVNSNAQTAHGKTEHYQRLQSLKKEYVTNVTIENTT